MTGTKPTAEESSTSQPRMLLVEQDGKLADSIARIAQEDLGCQVIRAQSCKQARQILTRSPVELLVSNHKLPDGDGVSLVDSLKRRRPDGTAVLTGDKPTVDDILGALRHGAADFLPIPATGAQIASRLRQAMQKHLAAAHVERRIGRLSSAVKRLNAARKHVGQKVDLLCNDLIKAYSDLSKQMDSVRTHEDFRKTLERAQDLEQLLCHAMDWIVRRMGYTNIAVWMASDESQFQLGAYIKYTVSSEPKLLEAMKSGILDITLKEHIVHLSPEDAARRLNPGELQFLEGHTVLAANCTYLGESLAAIVLYRDGATPFTAENAELLFAIAPIFALTLASATKVSEDDEEEESEAEADKNNPKNEADWWKSGEPPPF